VPTLKKLEKWLSTSQVASRLGKSRQGVLWMLENGRLRGVQTALGWLVDPEDVERYEKRMWVEKK
jgi:excisionase family DNA binding protein